MRKMQDAENEGEGSVLTYVTEPEFLKQHGSLRVMTYRRGRTFFGEHDRFFVYSLRAILCLLVL